MDLQGPEWSWVVLSCLYWWVVQGWLNRCCLELSSPIVSINCQHHSQFCWGSQGVRTCWISLDQMGPKWYWVVLSCLEWSWVVLLHYCFTCVSKVFQEWLKVFSSHLSHRSYLRIRRACFYRLDNWQTQIYNLVSDQSHFQLSIFGSIQSLMLMFICKKEHFSKSQIFEISLE